MSGEVVEYRPPRRRMALYAAFLLLGVPVGAKMLLAPRAGHGSWEGALVVLLLGAAGGFYLWEALRPGIVLRIDATGVHFRQAFGKSVFELSWSEIVRVRAANVYGQPTVLFAARDPNRGLAEANPWVRRIRQVSLDAFGTWMSVPTRILGVAPERVVEDVERLGRLYASATATPLSERSMSADDSSKTRASVRAGNAETSTLKNN